MQRSAADIYEEIGRRVLALKELHTLNFAKSQKRRNCKKGYRCGYSCINTSYNCLKRLEGDALSFAKYLESIGYDNLTSEQREQADKQGLGKTAKNKAENIQIQKAEQDLADRQREVELLSRYRELQTFGISAKSKPLSPKERQEVALLLDKGTVYKAMEGARERAFLAQQELDRLRGTNQQADAKTPATGPMSIKEANTALSPDELARVRTTLDLKDGRQWSQARVDLSSSSAGAQPVLTRLKEQGNVSKNLTLTDVQAIRSYTGNGYVGINGAMRGLQTDPTSDMAQRQRLLARQLNQAVQKMPRYEGELRRDTKMDRTAIERDFQVGNVITFKGITSTSTDITGGAAGSYGSTESLTKASFFRDKAERAGIEVPDDGRNQVNVIYRITTRKGRDIGGASTRAFEQEVVLPHGWQGRVTRVEAEGNKQVIYLEDATDEQ